MSDKKSKSETKMAEKLAGAVEQVETATKARREREVKGSHLVDPMRKAAEEKGCSVVEKSGFLKITGVAKKRAIYLARKGGRVDLSGFTVAAGAVAQITEEDAKAKHLGLVRGQIDFTKDDADVMAAYGKALNALLEASAEQPPKPAKAPRAPKTAKPTETTETPAESSDSAEA